MKESDEVIFYAIRNREGKFFKTYKNSSPAGWVDELAKARIYAKESMARGKVTAYSNTHPREPVPDIVEFHVTEIRVIDQKSRVAEAKNKKLEEEIQKKKMIAQRQLEEAEKAFNDAKKKLLKLKSSDGLWVPCTCGSCKSCMGM